MFMLTKFDHLVIFPVHPDWAREYYEQQRAKGQAAEYGHPLSRLQMDSHSFSLLEGPRTLRRNRL